MRRAPLLVLCLLASMQGAASQAQQANEAKPGVPAEAPKPTSITRPKTCADLPEVSSDDHNKKCVAAAGRLAALRGDTLILRLDDGTRKTFTNTNDDDTAYGYMLWDFRPEQHIFLVNFAMDDGGKATVIYGKTGLVLDCGAAWPRISPDGAWVMLETTPEDEPPQLAMVDASGATAKTVWVSKDDATTISTEHLKFMRWDDDAHVRFKLGTGDARVLLVRAADGHWHYDLASGPPPADPAQAPAKPALAKPALTKPALAKPDPTPSAPPAATPMELQPKH